MSISDINNSELTRLLSFQLLVMRAWGCVFAFCPPFHLAKSSARARKLGKMEHTVLLANVGGIWHPSLLIGRNCKRSRLGRHWAKNRWPLVSDLPRRPDRECQNNSPKNGEIKTVKNS
jgi:hypothetical protein